MRIPNLFLMPGKTPVPRSTDIHGLYFEGMDSFSIDQFSSSGATRCGRLKTKKAGMLKALYQSRTPTFWTRDATCDENYIEPHGVIG